MRSIAKLGMVAVAATLVGCQFTGAYRDAQYAASATAYTDEIKPRPVYVPYIISFPDNTMYFYPIYDDQPPHSDLKLNSMSCIAGNDGFVVVAANVKNLGSNIVPPIPLLSGDLGAFRIGATVTTASGVREQVYATQYVPLTVGATVTLVLSPLRAPAGDIVRIDVEADPDRIVPDPLRDNNTLSWQGTMLAASPQCTVMR
ncbi:MAG: hypothetical protein E6H78_05095 [Betaproteobacteria bacterium]|nr:MAG: hypothetical protein E6H78_05095 [Betaproteobacteria bacterium]